MEKKGNRPLVIASAALVAALVGAGVLLRRAPASNAGVPETEQEPALERGQGDDPPAREPAPAAPAGDLLGAPAAAPTAKDLVDQLTALLGRDPLTADETARLADLEARLRAMGEGAAPFLIDRLNAARDPASARERLFNLLRQLPGAAVEVHLVTEARAGASETMRTMAIESLGQRKTPAALEALASIAQNDPNVPARPFIVGPRSADDTGTELPDEQVFTPRMQAMVALASAGDPRATGVLAQIARTGPDESLRMEAARNLEKLRGDARAAEALREAAGHDPSAYVRLAALHSLAGSTDPALPPLLDQIAAQDADAGVRLLARQVLGGLAH